MKTLSLWQPWATLMALGLKKIETRSWPTRYRGPLAIHAALEYDTQPPEILVNVVIGAIHATFPSIDLPSLKDWMILRRACLQFKMDKLPRGGIIAVVDLIDCVEITKHNHPASPEWEYGDYTPGRFMWITENIKPLRKIIPFRGRHGLFNVPDEALRVCRACGCSEFNACEGGCSWVEEDLCNNPVCIA